MRAAVALRHQVDSFRGPSNKNNLPGVGGVDELLHLDPALFVKPRGSLTQLMDCPVDVRVVLGIKAADRVDHRQRFLTTSRAIKVDERLSVDLLTQDRKVFS